MSKVNIPPSTFVTCEKCGLDRSLHLLANVSDGNLIGQYFLVCPTVIFSAKGFDLAGRSISEEVESPNKMLSTRD